MDFTVIEAATGRVLFGGTCEDRAALAQAGRVVLDVLAPAGADWWDGAAFQFKPQRPSRHHIWDWGAHSWVDNRTLAEAKQAKADELRAAAAAELLGYMDEIGEILGDVANGTAPPAAYRNKVAAFKTKAQSKRAAVVAATTVAEVDAINW